jgi:predicted dehydrogenase
VTFRTGIVGAGFVARVHAAAVRDLGGAVVAVCGRTTEGAAMFAAELDAKPYTSLEAMLRDERIDVLHVCTPNSLHAEQTLLALEHGAHVVCEKPLATSVDESAAMVSAAESADRVGAVAFHVRGYPLVEHMRAAVETGVIGDLRSVHGRYACDDALVTSGGWRVERLRAGPTYVMGDLGAHWLDLAEHVAQRRVVGVLADMQSFVEGRELEDHASLLLRFEGGAVGAATFSAIAPGRKNQLLFEIEGTEGGFTWDQESPNDLLHRHARAPTELVVKDPSTNLERAASFARWPAGHAEGYGDAFRNILRDAYLAMANEAHCPFPAFADGHRGMQLLDAAVRSATAGGVWASVRL